MATTSTGIDDVSGGGSNLPPLPVELWQRVVYFIDAWPLQNSGEATRRRVLHSLSLVSTWMHEIAQPHLYAYPCLVAADAAADGQQQESKDEKRQRRYWETICERPELWAHARGIFLGRRRTVVDDTTGRHGGGRADGSHGTSSRATTARVRSLAHAISGGTSTASSSAWAESFHLLHPYLPTPIGIGPSPLCLREVAWCEVGTGLGGLPASHNYSTRPEGEWCKGAYEMMEQRRRQVRAWSVEDVDLGRGPATMQEETERRARGAGEHATGTSRPAAATPTPNPSRYREQPSGLSEDDVWEAAERMTLQQSAVEKATPVVTPTSSLQDSSSPYPTSSMAPQREDLRNAWLRTAKLQQDRMALEHQQREQRRGTRQLHGSASTPCLVPWQYHLTLGSLDPHTLPHLICSLPTLTHISLTLYLGTHLDHDLLEHQLRLCLDSAGRLPLLERLEVRAGYDARGGGVGWGGGGSGGTGRLKREAFVRIVRGAVERVGDARCRFVGGGEWEEEGKLVDVTRDAVQAWARSVDESRCASDEVGTVERGDGDGAGKARSRGKPFINGWLARDVRGTNDPIEE